MFRRSKPQEPYEFDIAAERVLEGWKHAGEPILVEQTDEEAYESLTENVAEYHVSSYPAAGHKSSTEELLNLARSLASIKSS
jgi:predicted esterase